MGRTLPVPVSCQVCGDKSYGRHYGVYCCDGCSCFFKRSIRKAISYTCISGDNQCVIDKARRNWCPACRLQKCYSVKMNQTAVQEERGPRKKSGREDIGEEGLENGGVGVRKAKRARREPRRRVEAAPDPSPAHLESVLLLHVLRLASQVEKEMIWELKGPVLRFASEAGKRAGLESSWHALFLLHASTLQQAALHRLLAHASPKAQEAVETLRHLALDPQEVHLCTSLILTSSGPEEEGSGGARGLRELYRLMLLHHCAAFHPLDPLRSARVMLGVSSALEAEDLGPVGARVPDLLNSLLSPSPSSD